MAVAEAAMLLQGGMPLLAKASSSCESRLALRRCAEEEAAAAEAAAAAMEELAKASRS